jgi:hypothetical protein
MINQTAQKNAITKGSYPVKVEGSRMETVTKDKRQHPAKRPDYSLTDFETDRSIVARELRSLQRATEEGAKQIDMVAAERVFDEPLSRALIRRARGLHLIARDLTSLLRLVAQAHIPPQRRNDPSRQFDQGS